MFRCPILAFSLLAAPATAQTLIHDLPGGSTGEAFGYRVEVIGDVDLDGTDDFVVSAPGFNANAGIVVLYDGASATPLGDVQGAAPGDLFGLSLSALGDVDGDGVGDFAAGAPQVGPRGSGFVDPAVGAGYVRVLSGATLNVIRTHSGVALGDAYGSSVAGGADADGDGVWDYAIGAPYAMAAELRSGASGATIQTWQSYLPEFGYTVELAPDLDGDDLGDVVVAVTWEFLGFQGEVHAYSSATGLELWDVYSGIGGELGWSMLATDDVNGDGIGEVLLGDREWGNSFGATGEGTLRWVDGATGAVLLTQNSPAASGVVGFGLGLAHLGDLDGDGLRDYAVATPGFYESNGVAYSGKPLLMSHGWPPQYVGEIAAPGTTATFGQALAATDLDGNGIVDLIVGAPRDDGLQPESGRVRVYTLLTDPEVYCQSQANSQGCVPHTYWTGVPSAALSTFRVHAENVLNQKVGVLLWGPQPANVPFGTGTLCVGSPVVRTAGQVSGGNLGPDDCSGAFAYQFTSPYLANQGLVPGASVHAQYWSRDPAAASTFHLTDAVRFSVIP